MGTDSTNACYLLLHELGAKETNLGAHGLYLEWATDLITNNYGIVIIYIIKYIIIRW
jgi:Co/Zn/Cd efflux system component